MTDDTLSPQPETRLRKRRVSKKKPKTTMLAKFRGPAGGYWLLALMVALTLGYGAYGAWITREAGAAYSGLALGASKTDVRYIFGAPQGDQQAARWNYAAGTSAYAVHFDPAGKVTQIDCASVAGRASSLCPAVFGIAPGAGEHDVLQRLGAPSSQGFVGNTKRLNYPAIGVSFVLAQSQVVQIEHGKAQDAGFARQMLWQLLP